MFKYLHREKVHYDLEKKEDALILYEVIITPNRDHKVKIKSLRTWRADKLFDYLSVYFDNFQNLNVEQGRFILVLMSLLSSVNYHPDIEKVLDIVSRLSYEEISFWDWKITSLKNRGISGFKAMYMKD